MLCDRHVVKMSVEYAQILSTVHRLRQSPHAEHVYKATHIHHPCVQWAGAHVANYEWLLLHTRATWAEYTYRYGRTHASSALEPYLRHCPVENARQGRYGIFGDPPPLCMPDQYKVHGRAGWPNVVEAYRQYYAHEKRQFCTWRLRPEPDWYAEYMKLFASNASIVVDAPDEP